MDLLRFHDRYTARIEPIDSPNIPPPHSLIVGDEAKANVLLSVSKMSNKLLRFFIIRVFLVL